MALRAATSTPGSTGDCGGVGELRPQEGLSSSEERREGPQSLGLLEQLRAWGPSLDNSPRARKFPSLHPLHLQIFGVPPLKQRFFVGQDPEA